MLRNTIIAEIGQNHCGNMSLARVLIKEAWINGADLVKFQLYDSEYLYGEKQLSELSREQAIVLFEYGKYIGIEVFFSVFDRHRIAWCEEIKVSHYKISCAMSDNRFLVDDVLRTKVPIIMSSQKPREHDSRISLLYCVPKYPALLDDLKVSKVDVINDFQGFSDHTVGLEAAYIALVRGATIIAKHFALDHKIGVDSPWSMTPAELKTLCTFAHSVGEAL